jgi:hypothetical protein
MTWRSVAEAAAAGIAAPSVGIRPTAPRLSTALTCVNAKRRRCH